MPVRSRGSGNLVFAAKPGSPLPRGRTETGRLIPCHPTALWQSYAHAAQSEMAEDANTTRVDMNRMRRTVIAVATLSFWCGAIFAAAGFANAQDWPSRPVKFIVP